MPAKKPNTTESVREHWTNQRKGSAEPSRGSHFAAPAAREAPAPSAGSNALFVVPGPAQQPPQARPQRKISGVSGEIPAVPVRVKQSHVDSYSRYNRRYTDGTAGSASIEDVPYTAAPVLEPLQNAPAYTWLPFAAYGGVSFLACAVWAVYAALTARGAYAAGDVELTVGLLVLCLIVVGGLAVMGVTVGLTARSNPSLPKTDIWAAAMGKGSLMLLAGVAVWIGASAAVTYLVG